MECHLIERDYRKACFVLQDIIRACSIGMDPVTLSSELNPPVLDANYRRNENMVVRVDVVDRSFSMLSRNRLIARESTVNLFLLLILRKKWKKARLFWREYFVSPPEDNQLVNHSLVQQLDLLLVSLESGNVTTIEPLMEELWSLVSPQTWEILLLISKDFGAN